MPEVLAQEPASGNPNVGTDTSLKNVLPCHRQVEMSYSFAE